MALNKIFMKRGFLNYLIFSGILFTNIINPNKSIALTQENIDIKSCFLQISIMWLLQKMDQSFKR